MGIQINGQTDTVTSTTAGGSVKVTPLAASTGLNVGTGASISSPATNVLTLGTNNVEVVRISSSGNTGIGTNNPTSRLHVYNGDISITAPTNTNANLYLFNNAAISNAFRIGQGWSGNDNIGFLLNVANADMVLGTNNTERARITGVGSFGIGTNDPKSLLHLEGSDGVAQIRLQRASTNIYGIIRQSSAPYGITYDAVDVNTGAPTHTFRTSADGSTFTPRVTIDSSGRFGINTQSPSDRLHCDGTLRLGDNTWYHTIGAGTGNTEMVITANAGQGNATTAGTIIFKNSISAGAITERMRISSNGAVLLNGGVTQAVPFTIQSAAASNAGGNYPLASIISTTGPDSGAACLHLGKSDNSTSTSNVFQRFYINSAGTGSGQINANGASSAAFGTFSDERLKENITELPSQLQNICALRPVEFDYKDGSGHQIGFIAQEMQTVYPDVVGETEGMLTVTGWSKTEARLVKALQEAIGRIETLETEIAALKAQ